MNRIQLSPLTAPSRPRSRTTASSDSSSALPATERPVDYALFVPLHYESNYEYPLVVWLHGDGEDYQQLPQWMPQISMRNYLAVAPQGVPDRQGRGSATWPQSREGWHHALQGVWESIQSARTRYNIAPHRVMLVGSGSGGTMAFRVAFSRPQWFAAVASLNGPLPHNMAPLCNLIEARRVPVFWAHGRQNVEFGEAQLCSQLRLLHSAGFSLTLRQYPCCQSSSPQLLHDLNVWLMELITGHGDRSAAAQADTSESADS